ncbi:hypothetical protein CVT26_014987 [Gymnopilus dilepis]|uniref:Arrestin-like N-terminal domain-containing protein n=1 Tax=Gymnopilus dilepis TaxID=231916 RepID=A0A409YXS1_9AGAR|nr:hypothetical protein CVT26_014987 [Gymnopilus dilepis]
MDYLATPSTSELPSYSPSSPSPSYTCQLGSGERLLEHTPQSRTSRHPTSLFVKKAGRTTVILNDQEDGATMPSYGRSATISGNLFLEQSESIVEVVLKVKAKLDTTMSEGGGMSIKLIDDSYTLYSQSSSRTSKLPCPDQIPFTVRLPATFDHSGKTYPLPPSYSLNHFSLPSLIVRSSYTLHIVISRIRHKKLEIWPKTKQILVPFTYSPRTRANRPILPSPCFFSSVKTSPEEWHQAITPLKTRPNTQMDPIYCHLFVPAGRIYGLGDTIPFHVQLSGNICALQDLFSGAELDRVVSVDSDTTVVSSKNSRPQRSSSTPLLRVSLLRQVSVSMRQANSWKNSTLGEATLWPIPPDLSSCCSSTSQCREGHVDWEGEVQANGDITVGGFEAGNVHVKDFISLVLTPPNPLKSPWLQLQITIPIRLVTDSFVEVAGVEVGQL